ISKVKKTPIYFWVLDQWPETLVSMGVVRSKFLIFILSNFSKFIYRNCAAILGQSERFLQNLQKYEVPLNKLQYFPNWAEENFNQIENIRPAKKIKRKKITS
ncbi:glycosyltransferase WbuB, partial [Alphaproteobacteria bacterium]|nr:glycosyltransferase WbuB [Alphaproteobacteria bacterium]